ncbi:hypothetical protein [Clostridium sardiniense]|uniref:hypothetical protein n=1 Tax=Clostridium sardiniense TaxID=29369 RepID=UPI001FD532CE|nr:hypothetical protein [Clostridium sardiniense]MDQ0459090.1 hypothetical protein [Clostridium sardiniense]
MELKFRTLKESEIDVRVATVTEKGVSLLLYKDARCDMNILDEAVGPMNWKRAHTRENANCIVSIWDEDKEQWISKEDTGTESFTEKEKGQASDSFKRACFNWGIGRELYTAPFIWVSKENCNIKSKGNNKWTCTDKFSVEKIAYDENKNIVGLSIRNLTFKKRAFLIKPPEKEGENNV